MYTEQLDLSALHPLLRRQVKKYFSAAHLEDPLVWQFIIASNDSYMNYERDRDLLDHAALLNEREYVVVNNQLKQEIAQRQQSFEKLVEAANSLEIPEGAEQPQFSPDNLLGLVDYLKKQISYQKQIEAELKLAKEAAESATKTKSEFLSVMSHEIRTPLNAIVGLVYLIKQEHCPPAIAENLNSLQFATNNLYALINDILDFNKIEAGKIELEFADFDFKSLVSNIAKSHIANAAENRNTISLDIDDAVPDLLLGDAIRLTQIISNLVSNAVKFTKNGQITIRLHLKSLQGRRTTLLFMVEDTGIGIPEEQHQRIFELFTQADSNTTRQFGGTGLGLVISRRLLQLYNSDIMLESQPGKGSKFFFTIELQVGAPPAAAQEVVQTAPAQSPLEGVRVLLVEDYILNIKVAVKFFERWKVCYDIAENGALGVEKARQNQYDLILMDLQMPEMDGYSAARLIRTWAPDIPIIAITASATLSDKEQALAAGMNDYVLKPFNPHDLSSKIARYAGRAL